MGSAKSILNILVIGGSGFVSGTIVRCAKLMGHNVWTVTRGNRNIPAGAISLVADRKDRAEFAKAITDAAIAWDLAIDCIGYVPDDVRLDIDVLAPLVNHLVFISTDFVFDSARRCFPQDEETDFYASDLYGGQKRQCELELINNRTHAMNWSIIRPCHIYGVGSLLGCLPTHGRDPQLLTRLKAGEPLRLAGGGHFLQQPVFAEDLAQTILSMAGNTLTYKQIFCVAGPEIMESRQYYHTIAKILGVELKIEDLPVYSTLKEYPESAPFLCHRIYDMKKLRNADLTLPHTPFEHGVSSQVSALLQRC
jgi:nucleoside-diphosphate-sugar epimerase